MRDSCSNNGLSSLSRCSTHSRRTSDTFLKKKHTERAGRGGVWGGGQRERERKGERESQRERQRERERDRLRLRERRERERLLSHYYKKISSISLLNYDCYYIWPDLTQSCYVCWRVLTYDDVWWRMLTYADVCVAICDQTLPRAATQH